MDIVEEKHGDALLLRPRKRIDSNNSPEFEKRLMDLIETRPPGIVIDFSDLVYISSAGLRVLLKGGKRIKALDGKLVICALRPEIREVFQVSGFASLFGIHPDSAAALAALA